MPQIQERLDAAAINLSVDKDTAFLSFTPTTSGNCKLQVALDTATKVRVKITDGELSSWVYVNAAEDVVATALYTWAFEVRSGRSYEVRHDHESAVTVLEALATLDRLGQA